MTLQNKKILLGVTGSIAAYKACEIVRGLKKQGAEVRVVMTQSACELVQPLTFATLSEHTVYTEMFEQFQEKKIEHIALARWADAILIAPATANIMAKLAQGIADDLLSTICLATTSRIFVVPAMNQAMWQNETTQSSMDILRERNIELIGPASGEQACGEVGEGRMVAVSEVIDRMKHAFVEPILAGKTIVVTAGPTREPIDPVRYITNHSSGKMGYAIAKAAADYGAKVILITGPSSIPVPEKMDVIRVITAKEMFNAVMGVVKEADIFIAAAAVADYEMSEIRSQKMKKGAEEISLQFKKTPDILAAVAALPNAPFTVGFAAETENLWENATAKLKAKKIDLIAANLVGNDKGFHVNENELTLIAKNGGKKELVLQSKISLAYELLRYVFLLVM